MLYHYFDQYHYFDHFKILNFIILSRCRHRRRHQYEIIEKIFYETSLSIAKIYLLVISIQNNQSCKIFRIFSFLTHFYSHSISLIKNFSSFRLNIDDSDDQEHEIDHEIYVNRSINEIRSKNERSTIKRSKISKISSFIEQNY